MGRSKYQGSCPNCGSRMVEYTHSLSKGLVAGLKKFLEKFGDQPGEIADAGMSYTMRCNFQKLRYWDLIIKVGDPNGKGGRWRVTPAGVLFATGEREAPSKVRTFRGKWIAYDGPGVMFEKLTGGWKFRPEYSLQAIRHQPGQTELFGGGR